MIEIGKDTKFIWICLNVDCSCLFDKIGKRDNQPSLEDCIYCENLRFVEFGKNNYAENDLKMLEEVKNL